MNHPAFNFQTLSPDLVINAIESIGLRIDSGLTELNSYENRVYQFIDEDRHRYVVKFYRPLRWSEAQILEEHQFTAELFEEEIPVVAPLQLQGKTLHQYESFLFAVFPSIGARSFEIDNIDHLEWVGRFLGRIHQVGKDKHFLIRPTMSVDEYFFQPKQILLESDLVPPALKERFFQALNMLIDAATPHWNNHWHKTRLHGDCHPGNILWRDGPFFVDLDDSRNGPAIQDLWMLLHGERHEQRFQLDVLLESYSEFADFDVHELRLIEPLRAMRLVHYLAWIVKRWSDPAFPRSFPWIKEIAFWEQQLGIFAEQLVLLKEPPIQLTPMY